MEAKVTPAEGLPYIIRGILVSDYYPLDIGYAGFSGVRINFECASEEVEELTSGDLITIKGVNYRIAQMKSDGIGWVMLRLERQDNI